MNIILGRKNYELQTGILSYDIPGGTFLSNKEVALVAGTFYNSFKNVTQAKGNNKIVINWPVVTAANVYTLTEYVCVLPDGYYSFESVNAALEHFCVLNGLYLRDTAGGKNVYFFSVTANPIQYVGQLDVFHIPTAAQCTSSNLITGGITLNTGDRVYVPSINMGELGTMLGIPVASYPSAIQYTTAATWTKSPALSFLGPQDLVPDVNPVGSVLVRCNIVNSGSSYPTDLVAQIPVDSSFGGQTKFQAQTATFLPIVNGSYHRLTVSFMDQNLNPLIIPDPNMTFTLHIQNRRSRPEKS